LLFKLGDEIGANKAGATSHENGFWFGHRCIL
jgi:hypothetical protein